MIMIFSEEVGLNHKSFDSVLRWGGGPSDNWEKQKDGSKILWSEVDNLVGLGHGS